MKRPSMKKTVRVIGLTGAVGSGKSTVAGVWRRRGCRVLDADAVVRAALAPGGEAHRAVARRAGSGALLPDGRLDKKFLAERAFREPGFRRWLEGRLHPLVRRALRREARRGGPLVFDVPLLFEAGLDRRVDVIVVVASPRARRIARLVRSGRMSAADARRRDAAQMPLREKIRRADYVIDNRGSLEDLARESRRVLDLILP